MKREHLLLIIITFEINLNILSNDEILPNEQPNDPNSFNSEEEINIDQKFPLAKGWVLKGNQKLGRRAGKLEEEDIPKVNTIQNWINTYAHVSKERATECDLANEYENALNLSE
ncbi:hypothetical protein C1645_836415 [Glomus cerebriforme]|uniref:Uncharacterized protein n=1 Tax=Glomus cerebriforme TaxID=658196 RepID=A0A397S5X2_9GLOM|nr:hypothetical protein C1645_836415 [Glomus cerebriforme]